MRRSFLGVLVAVAALLGGCEHEASGVRLGGLGSGTGAETGAAQAAAGPLRLRSLTAEVELVTEPIVATGSARAVRVADLGAGLTGRITDIHVAEGDVVEERQLLVEVDDRSARAMGQQARAAATAAEVQATQAQADYERLAPLAASGSVAQSRVDQLRAQMEAAQESARAASAAARAAEATRVDASLRAPFAGTVIEVPVEVGEIATSMPVTTLVRLADLSQLEVSVRVHERFLRLITAGEPVDVRFPNMGIETTGQIYRIGLEVDPGTRTAEVLARVDNTELGLASGVFAELTFTPPGRQALFLPSSATAVQGGVTYVWVVSGNRLEQHAVEVLPAPGGRVEVVNGLSGGETLALGALSRLQDGARVEVAGASESAPVQTLTVAMGATP